LLLLQVAEFRDALTEIRRGHELGSRQTNWPYPSAGWLARAERMAALESRLPDVLRGAVKPKDAAEGIGFAELTYQTERYASSARLYAEVFQADPKLADDMKDGNRYNAVCSAALVAAGKGDGTIPVEESARARGRKQAIDWLRAGLAFWTKLAQAGKAEAKQRVSNRLRHWRQDLDLGAIRDEATVKALPENEQVACRALWADVEALLRSDSCDIHFGLLDAPFALAG
jgi:hypothetical protein